MGIEQLETLEAAEIFEAAGVIVGRDHRLSARWNTEAFTVAHQWGNLHRCNFQGDFRVLEELVTAAVARVAAGETVSTAAQQVKQWTELRLQQEQQSGVAWDVDSDFSLPFDMLVERQQRQAAGMEDRSGAQLERRQQQAAGAEDQQTTVPTAEEKKKERRRKKKERQKSAKAAKAKAAAVEAVGTPGPAAEAVEATAAAAARTDAVTAAEIEGTRVAATKPQADAQPQQVDWDWLSEAVESTEEAAVDPAPAGIAAAELAEVVTMEEAAAHWRERSLSVALEQMCWWLGEEAAEWAAEANREMRADHIWQCSREARFGAERRVWQQWGAVTAIWADKAAAAAAKAKATAVETAGTPEPAVDAVEAAAAEKATTEVAKAAAAAAETTAVEDNSWTCFMAAAEEAEEEYWQQQAADQDVQQWVSQVEEQAAAGEAQVVGAAMIGAAVEAACAAVAEAVEAAEAMRVQAAVEAVVWDTVETAVRAARGPKIVIEEKSEQGCGGDTDEGAQEMAAEAEVEAMDEAGRGASAEEIGARTRIFDPGIFNSDTFLFGVESFSC